MDISILFFQPTFNQPNLWLRHPRHKQSSFTVQGQSVMNCDVCICKELNADVVLSGCTDISFQVGRGPENRARNRTRKVLLLLALFCGPLCGLLCPVSVVLFPVRFCCLCLLFCAGRWVVSTVRVFPSLCFTGADPRTEHFRRQPPSTYAVTEYAATAYIGGNAGLPIVLYTVQFFSGFSPSSILASASCAFHRPSRERKRYYSLWSSVFPVPSARRGITSYSH